MRRPNLDRMRKYRPRVHDPEGACRPFLPGGRLITVPAIGEPDMETLARVRSLTHAYAAPTAPQSGDEWWVDPDDPGTLHARFHDPEEPAYAAGDQVDVYPATMRETCGVCGHPTGEATPGYLVVPATHHDT